jgi:hypothetical protein
VRERREGIEGTPRKACSGESFTWVLHVLGVLTKRQHLERYHNFGVDFIPTSPPLYKPLTALSLCPSLKLQGP